MITATKDFLRWPTDSPPETVQPIHPQTVRDATRKKSKVTQTLGLIFDDPSEKRNDRYLSALSKTTLFLSGLMVGGESAAPQSSVILSGLHPQLTTLFLTDNQVTREKSSGQLGSLMNKLAGAELSVSVSKA